MLGVSLPLRRREIITSADSDLLFELVEAFWSTLELKSVPKRTHFLNF